MVIKICFCKDFSKGKEVFRGKFILVSLGDGGIMKIILDAMGGDNAPREIVIEQLRQ